MSRTAEVLGIKEQGICSTGLLYGGAFAPQRFAPFQFRSDVRHHDDEVRIASGLPAAYEYLS